MVTTSKLKNKVIIMKKLLAILLSLTFIFSLAACGEEETVSTPEISSESSEQYTPVDMSIACMTGPTGIGMAKLMADSEAKTTANNYTFTVTSDASDITAKFIKGEINIASVPTNVAATLYKKTEKGVSVIAVNTLGVLSIVTNGENISSIADLKGKTIYATGQGATPEYALNYILEKNGLEVGKDVKVEYKGEHSELAALVTAGEVKIAMLPQPFVTTVTTANENVRVALDLSAEWAKISEVEGGELVMGCIIVRNEFLKNNKDAVNTFLNEYYHSTSYANEKHEKTGELSAEFDILPAAVVTKAIPSCNIVFIKGQEMKTSVSAYLKTLYDANPQSIGGELPDDAFYYVSE